MPSYFVNEPSATTFLPAQFKESFDGLNQPGGGASFSRDDGEASLVGTIPYENIRSARNQILGYAYCDDSSPWALHRVPPWRHPIFPEMRATDVHFQGHNPMGVSGNPSNAPYRDAAVPGDNLNRFLRYTEALTTIRFKPHPYLFKTDTELAGAAEYNRNCAIFDTLDPVLELILATTQPYLWFLEGTASDGTTQLTDGPTSFPGPMPEYVTKCLFVMAWFDVPWEFVANPYVPSKILQCVGHLNETDDWLNGGVSGAGFPKGTLLLEAPRIKRKLQPIWTVNDRSPVMCDIFLPFKWVDPFPGYSAPDTSPPTPAPIFRGWNLLPYGHNGDNNTGPKWYSVGRGETSGSSARPFLGFKNFDAMFTHVKGPTLP